MKYYISLLAMLFLLGNQAQAEVTITPASLQKGVFNVSGCDDGKPCLCEADIKYPVLGGMANEAAQAALNSSFKKSAEQVKCEGEASQETSKENSFTITFGYEVTFQSSKLLALRFTEWAFEGGAHGNGMVDSMIIDTEKGTVLTIADIFPPKALPEINQLIYNTLIPNAEDIFRDEIEKRKNGFLTMEKCQGCVVGLDKSGVNITFQAYEVAPFSSGNPVVAIPLQYVATPAITQSLASAPAK